MLIDFLLELKAFGLPVGTREYLTLLEALDKRVVSGSLDDFYALARLCLVKVEQLYDRFDAAFGAYFHGIGSRFEAEPRIPGEWLRGELARHLSEAAANTRRVSASDPAQAAAGPGSGSGTSAAFAASTATSSSTRAI